MRTERNVRNTGVGQANRLVQRMPDSDVNDRAEQANDLQPLAGRTRYRLNKIIHKDSAPKSLNAFNLRTEHSWGWRVFMLPPLPTKASQRDTLVIDTFPLGHASVSFPRPSLRCREPPEKSSLRNWQIPTLGRAFFMSRRSSTTSRRHCSDFPHSP